MSETAYDIFRMIDERAGEFVKWLFCDRVETTGEGWTVTLGAGHQLDISLRANELLGSECDGALIGEEYRDGSFFYYLTPDEIAMAAWGDLWRDGATDGGYELADRRIRIWLGIPPEGDRELTRPTPADLELMRIAQDELGGA